MKGKLCVTGGIHHSLIFCFGLFGLWGGFFSFYLEQNAGYILKTCFVFIRNFLKMKGKEESRVDWKMETLPHNKQMDSSSCGVLVLKVFNKQLYLMYLTRIKLINCNYCNIFYSLPNTTF